MTSKTTQPTKEQIQPCPFCSHVSPAVYEPAHGGFAVLCGACGAEGPFTEESAQHAVEGWNGRAHLRAPDAKWPETAALLRHSLDHNDGNDEVVHMNRELVARAMNELRAPDGQERDAARYRWLVQCRELVFRDDNGLWVGTWKRAIGDTQGIIGALIDVQLPQPAGGRECETPEVCAVSKLRHRRITNWTEWGAEIISYEPCPSCQPAPLPPGTLAAQIESARAEWGAVPDRYKGQPAPQPESGDELTLADIDSEAAAMLAPLQPESKLPADVVTLYPRLHRFDGYDYIAVADYDAKVRELKALNGMSQGEQTDAEKLLREVDEYLSGNLHNSIWSGSKLHQNIKHALGRAEQQP